MNHWLLTSWVRSDLRSGSPRVEFARRIRGSDRAAGSRHEVGTPCSSEGAFPSAARRSWSEPLVAYEQADADPRRWRSLRTP